MGHHDDMVSLKNVPLLRVSIPAVTGTAEGITLYRTKCFFNLYVLDGVSQRDPLFIVKLIKG